MLTLVAFPWRRLTERSALEHRLDEAGELLLRGAVGSVPPIDAVSVRDGAGGFVTRPLAALGFEWTQAASGDGWRLRTSGAPNTMLRANALWGDLARAASESSGLDERLVLVTIACESSGAAPDAKGLVYAPRTEKGYPRRTGEHDPGDLARDAEDWKLSRGAHSSHGLMQTLIGTAVAACPELFAGVLPKNYRTVLWVPRNTIACGTRHLAHFSAEVLSDPLAVRFSYASGSVRPAANRWGAVLYDELVPLMAIALWNDDAAVRRGEGAGKGPALMPASYVASNLEPPRMPVGVGGARMPRAAVSTLGPSLLLSGLVVIFGAILGRGAHR